MNIMTTYNFRSKAFLFALLLALASCNMGKKDKLETTEVEIIPEDIVEMRADQIKLANIEMGVVEQRALSGTLRVNGLVAVSPQNLATVCVPLGGFIKRIYLTPGSTVHKGQTLAIIENQEFIELQQKYLESKSQLEYLEAEYQRQKELFAQNVSAAKTFQQTTANYNSLKSQVKAFEQKLLLTGIDPSKLQIDDISSSISIKSPISGYVQTVHVNMGKYVSPSDILFEIVNSDKLLLELTLFEKDAEKVSKGENIQFYINNETEQHQAVVFQTGKSINSDKTYKVFANVSGFCKNLLPGMYVNALIETTNHEVTALPSEAVISFEDKAYIFIFDKDKEEGGKPFTEYRMIEVQKGVTDGEYTEISLPKGFNIKTAKVVTKGAYNLMSAKKNAGEMSCG